MFCNLVKSFKRQVVITRAHKNVKYFWNKYNAFVELSDKNMDKNYSRQKIKSRMDRRKKGIANADRKNFSGPFFVQTIFCPNIFFSRQFICPDNFFVRPFFFRTKGHSPPSKILPSVEGLLSTGPTPSSLSYKTVLDVENHPASHISLNITLMDV